MISLSRSASAAGLSGVRVACAPLAGMILLDVLVTVAFDPLEVAEADLSSRASSLSRLVPCALARAFATLAAAC